MKEIPLTRGKVALVDDEDYDYLSQWKWYAYPNHGNWYAVRGVRKFPHYWTIRMHRVVVNAPEDMHVDHIDFDGLNNQKKNLRLCSRYENGRHMRLRKDNTTGYKGVYPCPYNKFGATIYIDGKQTYLGAFDTPEDAARSYDYFAKMYYKEFAVLNFPE